MLKIHHVFINKSATFFACCSIDCVSIYSANPVLKLFEITCDELKGRPIKCKLHNKSNLVIILVKAINNGRKLILYDLAKHKRKELGPYSLPKKRCDLKTFTVMEGERMFVNHQTLNFCSDLELQDVDPIVVDIRHEPDILKDVLMTNSVLIIVFVRKVLFFDYKNFHLKECDGEKGNESIEYKFRENTLKFIDTSYNQNGICAYHEATNQISYPSDRPGSIEVRKISSNPREFISPKIIRAHMAAVQLITFSCDGSMIATASIKGTLFRLFNTNGSCVNPIMEFRRGIDCAFIYSMRFMDHDTFLTCCSDKGTVHVFAVAETTLNKKTRLSSVGFLSAYNNSLYGLSKFPLFTEKNSAAAFTNRGHVLAVSGDGFIHRYAFNRRGVASCISYTHFLRLKM